MKKNPKTYNLLISKRDAKVLLRALAVLLRAPNEGPRAPMAGLAERILRLVEEEGI